MTHECHIRQCRTPVAREMLMCHPHWSMLPDALKDAVTRNFNPKQCRGKVRPTDAWLKAARAAINHVETVCGLKSPLREGK